MTREPLGSVSAKPLSVVAIVVNYNSGDWLRRCVAALCASTVPIRVHVVDNASVDQSVENLRRSAPDAESATVIANSVNVGFAAANNQVLGAVHADYFVLVNPDCIVAPDTVETVVGEMERAADIGLAGCIIRNADDSIQSTCRRRFPTPVSAMGRMFGLQRVFPKVRAFSDFNEGTVSLGSEVEDVEAISGAFMVARGAAVARVGLLDEGYFMHCEDLDWCMRFWNNGYRVVFVPFAEVKHQKGVSGRTHPFRVNWYMHKGMLRFYKKFYRRRYPLPVMWLVYAGVFVRLGMKNLAALFKG